ASQTFIPIASWSRSGTLADELLQFRSPDFIKSYAYYSLVLLARASSRNGRAGFPATDPFGEIDFVTTAPAEIFVPEPTMSGFPTLPLTMVDPAPTKTSSSITTYADTDHEGQTVT